MYMVGLIDDIYDLRPYLKLASNCCNFNCYVLWNYNRLYFIANWSNDSFWHIQHSITVIWIVAITNAINLIDGLDGLASGVSALALMTIGFIAILQANIFIIMICCVLLGSLLGFLFYNFHPAKIFLGDSGALMIDLLSVSYPYSALRISHLLHYSFL